MLIIQPTGLRYTWRGDPTGYDFTQANLTLDSALHNLDLSAIVPSKAKLVHIRCRAKKDTATGVVGFCATGNVNVIALPLLRIQVANIYNEMTFIVPISKAGIVQYYAVSGIDNIDIVILGWFY